MKKVYVGLSGGVDSSVAALLLKQQGYNVTGVYMKNWSQDLPGMPCPWKEDYQDAKRVAIQLGIDFKVYDFEKQYKDKVVKYMLDGFKAGITPNPDIMCNQEIKFKLFLETALEDGADLIATGHYARLMPLAASPASSRAGTLRSSRRSAASELPVLSHRSNAYGSLRASVHPGSSSEPKTSDGPVGLFRAVDENKDQTYFLYRVTEEALQKTIFPLGSLTKPQVRDLAKKHRLITADKKESMGICFVGKVGIKDFLQQYVKAKSGKIINQSGKVIGEHDGTIFYTIGQRHGLEVGGGLPYYVTGKDMKKDEVYVTTDLQDENLWNDKITFTSANWLNGDPKNCQKLMVRTRHRAKLIPVKKLNKPAPPQNLSGAVGNRIVEPQVLAAGLSNSQWVAELEEEVRALTPGQSAVFYLGGECLGGGIVV